jgi:translocation and assembly module TamB
LEQLCLRDAKARVCGQVADLAGERSARFNAENLPLRALTAGLIAATDFDGTLSVNAEANAHREGGWIGSLRSQLQGAAIRHRHSNGRMESFDLGTGSVSVTLGADTLVANVGLNAGNTGLIEGSATARTNGGDWQQWPMTGHVKLQSEALGMLDSYFPQIDRASGKVTADLDLGGAVWAPSLSGTLSVRSARIDAYQVGASLRDLNLDAQLHDNTLAIGGSATAGVDGTAKFSGNLRWQNQLLYGTLHLDGQNLLIVDIPEAKIYAAPNVDLTLAGRRIDVTGTIELPNARLEQPEDLATAVRVSGDTRIIQAGDDTKADPFPVYSNVTLKLGDRVTINTSGLQARLSGSITSVTDESGFSRGTGELSIEEGGKYTAYGRRLDITRGRLLFTNSPMGNPGVDLRAVKKFPGAADVGEVTAGVNVRGTLSAPTVSFFSDPPLPQLSIVSLLISGGSLDNVLSGDSAVDATAERKARLLQGSAILAQQLGKRVGADVSVEQDLQNDTSLVLGRFLSPRLYVSYGISFAEAINTIKMNYTIGDKWTVRTESGQAKSADLVYTIRK